MVRCLIGDNSTVTDKRIGWHMSRHTFGTILNANGENPKVIQELLRHANLKVTMDICVQAVSDEKRKAQARLSRCFCLVFAKGKRSLMDPYRSLGENGLSVTD